METTNFYFSNDFADAVITANEQTDFDMQNFSAPGPEDEDESEDEDKSEDTSDESASGDPALDDDVVHSPVTTQPGGKPKK